MGESCERPKLASGEDPLDGEGPLSRRSEKGMRGVEDTESQKATDRG